MSSELKQLYQWRDPGTGLGTTRASVQHMSPGRVGTCSMKTEQNACTLLTLPRLPRLLISHCIWRAVLACDGLLRADTWGLRPVPASDELRAELAPARDALVLTDRALLPAALPAPERNGPACASLSPLADTPTSSCSAVEVTPAPNCTGMSDSS